MAEEFLDRPELLGTPRDEPLRRPWSRTIVALQALLVACVVAWVLDLQQKVGIALYTEQFLVTVLGLARSGIALARFLVGSGARVTIYDGRPEAELRGAIDQLEGRPVRLALGPDVEPATTWADARLVTTSPSINPAYPTTEPRLRSALQALVDAVKASDAARAEAIMRDESTRAGSEVLRLLGPHTGAVAGAR